MIRKYVRLNADREWSRSSRKIFSESDYADRLIRVEILDGAIHKPSQSLPAITRL